MFARWALILMDYDFDIIHREGKAQRADLPSRHPRDTTEDGTGACMDPEPGAGAIPLEASVATSLQPVSAFLADLDRWPAAHVPSMAWSEQDALGCIDALAPTMSALLAGSKWLPYGRC